MIFIKTTKFTVKDFTNKPCNLNWSLPHKSSCKTEQTELSQMLVTNCHQFTCWFSMISGYGRVLGLTPTEEDEGEWRQMPGSAWPPPASQQPGAGATLTPGGHRHVTQHYSKHYHPDFHHPYLPHYHLILPTTSSSSSSSLLTDIK